MLGHLGGGCHAATPGRACSAAEVNTNQQHVACKTHLHLQEKPQPQHIVCWVRLQGQAKRLGVVSLHAAWEQVWWCAVVRSTAWQVCAWVSVLWGACSQQQGVQRTS